MAPPVRVSAYVLQQRLAPSRGRGAAANRTTHNPTLRVSPACGSVALCLSLPPLSSLSPLSPSLSLSLSLALSFSISLSLSLSLCLQFWFRIFSRDACHHESSTLRLKTNLDGISRFARDAIFLYTSAMRFVRRVVFSIFNSAFRWGVKIIYCNQARRPQNKHGVPLP